MCSASLGDKPEQGRALLQALTRRRRRLRGLLCAPHALRVQLPALQVGVQHKRHLIALLQDVLASHLQAQEGV